MNKCDNWTLSFVPFSTRSLLDAGLLLQSMLINAKRHAIRQFISAISVVTSSNCLKSLGIPIPTTDVSMRYQQGELPTLKLQCLYMSYLPIIQRPIAITNSASSSHIASMSTTRSPCRSRSCDTANLTVLPVVWKW